ASEKNRIQKVLEVANVKIGNVMSDVFGVSGQEMLEALLSGREIEAEEIAGMAKTQLRDKIPQLTETLKGHQLNDHHRWLIQQSIDHIVLLDRQVEQLEDRIREKVEPYRKQLDLICTVPGFKEMNGAALLAEIGPHMSVFPDGDHLCSWGGRCSGNVSFRQGCTSRKISGKLSARWAWKRIAIVPWHPFSGISLDFSSIFR